MSNVFQQRWDNTTEEQRAEIGNKISQSKKGIATIPADKRQEVARKSLDTRRKNGNMARSIETKQKISNSLLGHYVSDETRHKISESGKGRVSHNAKAVICIETGVEYRSAHFAELELGLPKDSVYRCCKGLQEQVNGYH